MAYGGLKAARKEKKEHDELLKLLKKHFMEDELEMMEGEDDEMKPMSKMMGLKRGKSYGDSQEPDMEYEGMEEDYEKEGEDDDYYEDLMEGDEEEESPKKLDKEARKNLAIVLITKKAGMGDRKKK